MVTLTIENWEVAMKKSRIILLMIFFTLVLAFGCSKNEPESGNDSGKGEETAVTGTAEPEKENPTVTPTAELKPTEEANTDSDLDSDKKNDTGSSSAGQESFEKDSNDSRKNAGLSHEGSDAGNAGKELPDITIAPDPLATGDVEPNDKPVLTDFPDPIDIDYLEEDILEKKYTDFAGTDEAAAEIAEIFANAYLLGDNDILIETIAYDEEYMSLLTNDLDHQKGYSSFFESYLATGNIEPEDIDMNGLLSMKISGGAVIDKQEVIDYLDYYDIYVDDLSEWDDYQIFSAAFEGFYARAISDYEDEGLNVIVAKKDGEYKVLTVDFYEIEEEQVDQEEIKAMITANKYNFTGEEKADDIADLYKGAFEDYDFFKMFSTLALDEEYEAEVFLNNEYLYYAFELCRHIKPGRISTTVTRSESEPVTDAEIKSILNDYSWIDDSNDITDVTKYEFSVSLMEGNEEFVNDYLLYIGKFKGAYRVIDNYMFE